jgi:hypothetical protein
VSQESPVSSPPSALGSTSSLARSPTQALLCSFSCRAARFPALKVYLARQGSFAVRLLSGSTLSLARRPARSGRRSSFNWLAARSRASAAPLASRGRSTFEVPSRWGSTSCLAPPLAPASQYSSSSLAAPSPASVASLATRGRMFCKAPRPSGSTLSLAPTRLLAWVWSFVCARRWRTPARRAPSARQAQPTTLCTPRVKRAPPHRRQPPARR